MIESKLVVRRLDVELRTNFKDFYLQWWLKYGPTIANIFIKASQTVQIPIYPYYQVLCHLPLHQHVVVVVRGTCGTC